jgi:hypothetical protein
MQPGPFPEAYIDQLRDSLKKHLGIKPPDDEYFLFTDVTSNYSYDPLDNRIDVLLKNGDVIGLPEASGLFNLTLLTSPDIKHVLVYPKKISPVKN